MEIRVGVEPFELKYMPEQGIEVHGQVVSFVRGKPKPNIQVSSFLAKREMRKLRRERFLLTCLKQTVWDVLLLLPILLASGI